MTRRPGIADLAAVRAPRSSRPGTGSTGPTPAYVTTIGHGAPRALPDRGRQAGGRAAGRHRRDLLHANLRVLGRQLSRARWSSTSSRSRRSSRRWCCRSSAPPPTGPPRKRPDGRLRLGRQRLRGRLMFLVAGHNWQLGVVLLVLANLCLGARPGRLLRVPVQIATPGRARPGLRVGWAFGYLGGGILLALNLVLVRLARRASASSRARRPDQPAVRRRLVGGVHRHPVTAACATASRSTWRRAAAAWSAAELRPAGAAPCATCAATRRR